MALTSLVEPAHENENGRKNLEPSPEPCRLEYLHLKARDRLQITLRL